MNVLPYIYKLCERIPRCGPGDDDATAQAYAAIPGPPAKPSILDVGCGTGAQTLALARICDGHIMALDNYQGFLDILEQRAQAGGFGARIETRCQSMLEMDFAPASFDIIWSEGALYSMGFGNGVRRCRELVKDGGALGATELVWLTDERPQPIHDYLTEEYPDIQTVDQRLSQIRDAGWTVLLHFTLAESAWLKPYFEPMEAVLPGLLEEHSHDETARAVFAAFQTEIDYYRTYSAYYGYEFFVLRAE